MFLRPFSTALLASTLCLLPGCIDPTSLGQETDDTSEGSGESGGTGDTGDTGDSASTAPSTDASGTDDAGTDDTSSDTGVGCPPIDTAECVECECIDNEWNCSSEGCVYDCSDQACGDACMMCPEGDPDCTSPEYEGVCTSDSQCVGVPPPELGLCIGALEPGFEDELTERAGCGDVVTYAYDAADERAVVVWVDQQLAQDAIDTGMPTSIQLPATDPSVQLEGRAGFSVTANECNDAPFPDVQIDENWLPTAGTVVVDVTPDGMGMATATVQLVDVELARLQPGPAPITINLTMADVVVGWFPG